jgi:tetratricopeptide (TPR) repeat protein
VGSVTARFLLFLAPVLLVSSLGTPAPAETRPNPAGEPVTVAQADSEPKKKERRWGRRDEKKGEKAWGHSYTVDERTAKRLAEAYGYLQAEQYEEAAKALGKLRMRSLNPLERAKVHQIQAFVKYGQDDLASAREHLEKAIAEDVFEPAVRADARYQIAQLFLAEENWGEVVKNLERWFTMVENPNSSAYYLLAIAYYQLDDLESALEPARKAVEVATAPQEGWLQLLLALRLTRKEYPAAVPLLEELIERYPKKTYWIQLSTVHGALGDYEEALVPLQLAYNQGLLTERAELQRLAELLLFLDLPYRAALVMAQSLDEKLFEADAKAYELLSNSWIAAREYENAAEPLARAAELSEGGDLYVRLAQVHIQREKWSEAAAALRLALEKGGLASVGDAQLLMGIAYYSQDQPGQAQKWFARARQHDETRDEAKNWLQYIEREMQSG